MRRKEGRREGRREGRQAKNPLKLKVDLPYNPVIPLLGKYI
jgi:hypothetical protein